MPPPIAAAISASAIELMLADFADISLLTRYYFHAAIILRRVID